MVMPIIFALILAVIFQFLAAIIAISLIRRTRYNFSWLLISVAFLLMAVRRLMELLSFLRGNFEPDGSTFSSWTAVAISVCMLIGLIYIRRIFSMQRRLDEMKQEQESRILSAIIRTEENERQKFAKELHDGLGPLIASIKMSLTALVPVRDEPGNRKILENTGKLIDESVSTIKEISNKLSPHVLNNFGLLRAIRSFIEKVEPPETLNLKINSNIGEVRFDHNIEVILYRIVCELITNTLRHAEASEVIIDLHYVKNKLELKYRDNGRGFDAESVLRSDAGMGLANIQSRIKSIHGILKINSSPDEGVSISISIEI